MAITISGENNNDRITAQDGVIDTISGFNISGIITASSFTGDLTGDVTGNVTGNVNNTTLLLQTGGYERIRITSDGKISTGALASPDGQLHIHNSTAGSVTAATDANTLVIESSTNVGMSFLTAANSLARIKFGDSDANNAGAFVYNHQNDKLSIITGTSNRMIIGSDMISARTDYGIARTAGGYTFREVNEGGERAGMHSDASNHLIFKAGGASEKVRISSNGNVGVNSTSPGALLDLSSSQPGILFSETGVSANNGKWLNQANASELYWQAQTDAHSGGGNLFKMTRSAQQIQSFEAQQSGVTWFTIRNSDRRVGIGTDNPGSTLQIVSDLNNILQIRSTNRYSTMYMLDSIGSTFMQCDSGDIRLGTGGSANVTGGESERVRIDSNGRVLIGHSSTPNAVASVAVVGSYGASSNLTPFVYLCRDENATSITNNESLGQILFASKDGYRGAVIEAKAGGTWSGSSSDGYFVFKTTPDNSIVPVERIRINSSGYVGVKRSTPLANLHTTNNELAIGANPTGAIAPNATYDGLVVDGEDASIINIRSSADGDISYGRVSFSDDVRSRGYIDYRHRDGAGGALEYLNIAVAGSQRLRIDVSGRSLFRTDGSQTTPINDNNVPVQIAESSAGMTYFGANLGTSYGALFGYHASFGGTVIRNVNATDIVFYTNNTVERLRIDSSSPSVTVKNAEFQVHENELQVTSSNSYASHFNYQDNGSNYISFKNTGSTVFRNNTGSGYVMVVYGSGNIGAPTGNNIYNASDERLKENMVELTNGLDKIKKLKPYSFTWKKGFDQDLEGVTQYGFGAHQAKTVDEKLVEKFSENDIELDGETIKDPLRVNEKHVIPLLVKAIQEQQEQIEILKSEVNALKGS